MATTPTAAPSAPPNFKPAFARIPQTNDFDCWLAAISAIVNRPLSEVKAVAEKHFRHPKHGPYTFQDEVMIAKLLACGR